MPVIAIARIVFGNVLLCLFLCLLGKWLGHSDVLLNMIVASLIFFSVTLFSLWKVSSASQKNTDPKLMFLSRGMALIRIVISLVWMIILKEIYGEVKPHQLLQFILIYVYYLVIDVYYLDALFRGRKI